MAKKSSNAIAITKSEDDWQIESDYRTVIEAEKIKADAKRYAKVQALAKRRMMEAAALASESAKD